MSGGPRPRPPGGALSLSGPRGQGSGPLGGWDAQARSTSEGVCPELCPSRTEPTHSPHSPQARGQAGPASPTGCPPRTSSQPLSAPLGQGRYVSPRPRLGRAGAGGDLGERGHGPVSMCLAHRAVSPARCCFLEGTFVISCALRGTFLGLSPRLRIPLGFSVGAARPCRVPVSAVAPRAPGLPPLLLRDPGSPPAGAPLWSCGAGREGQARGSETGSLPRQESQESSVSPRRDFSPAFRQQRTLCEQL